MRVESRPASISNAAYMVVYDDDGHVVYEYFYIPSWHQWGPMWFVEWRMRRLARRAMRTAALQRWAYRG